jgi:hypothetical protein
MKNNQINPFVYPGIKTLVIEIKPPLWDRLEKFNPYYLPIKNRAANNIHSTLPD